MKMALETADTLNEMGWWSCWARSFTPAQGVRALVSREFAEPIFNRALFLRPPRDADGTVDQVVTEFRRRGTKPSLFVKEGDDYADVRDAASRAGMRRTGRLVIMEEVGLEPRGGEGVEVRQASKSELTDWTRAYLRAFYDDEALLSQVSKSVAKARSSRANRLVLASRDGEAVGTMALHTERGCTGLYCLGTVPSARGAGVAGSMLVMAHEVASALRTKLVLQVFESDGVEQFYAERGYRRAYVEEILGWA